MLEDSRSGRRRRVSRFLRGSVLAVLAAAMRIAPTAAAAAPSVVRGVYLLPAGNRVSVVVDFDRSVGATRVDVRETDTFVVDIGPVSKAAVAEVLRTSTSRLVREVRIDPLTNAAHQPMVRVHVKMQTRAAGSVRVADRRVYLDFAPASAQPPDPTIVTSRPAAAVMPPDKKEAQLVSPTAGPPAGIPVNAVLDRAKALAELPDVKGLVDLRTRAAQLAATTSTDVAPDGGQKNLELAQIDEYLAKAQQLQLAKDAQLFRRHQVEEYVDALRRTATDLDKIGIGLKSTTATGGDLSDLHIKSIQVATRLHAIQAPSEFADRHAAACTAADEAVASLGNTSGDPRTVMAGASAAIERARAALKEGLVAASAHDPQIR